ncbi:MAG: fasciclin domain-containing protein [Cyanothece sp. SIO1E1]|nr:fasciclin domain-containing protein [Cyanothece sp. SIO1E1]
MNMHSQNRLMIRRFIGIVTLASTGALIGLPVLAQLNEVTENPALEVTESLEATEEAEITPIESLESPEVLGNLEDTSVETSEKPEASEAESVTESSESLDEVESLGIPSETSVETETIVDIAVSNDSFTILAQALAAAGMVEALESEGPFTVFAPTDEAFAALPEGVMEELLKPENQSMLIQILAYHVLPGEITSAQLSSGEVITAEGSTVQVEVTDSVMVNDAHVVEADILASNGVIHVIDKVILPPNLLVGDENSTIDSAS